MTDTSTGDPTVRRQARNGPPRAWLLIVGMVRAVLRRVFGWRLVVRVEGPPPPADEPLVVVANHTSNIDPFLVADTVWQVTGHWIQPLAKAEIFEVPVLGSLATRAGAIPVERGEGAGRDQAFDAAVQRVREGGTVYIAPEGTVTHDGTLLPLRHGAARLALDADAPVLVVTHFGAQRGWSPVALLPDRDVEVHLVLELLQDDPGQDAAALTGRIAATMLAHGQRLADRYPQGGPTSPWWPPYAEPGTPSRTARENIERYRTSMAEAVAGARVRMAELSEESDVEARLQQAGERAREAADRALVRAEDAADRARLRAGEAADRARVRAEELVTQLRSRSDELVELGRSGALGEVARERSEALAERARELAEEGRNLLLEDAYDEPEPDNDPDQTDPADAAEVG